MPARADAHIHLFADSYQGESFSRRAGVRIDDLACYQSLAASYGVEAALVVGYEGQEFCAGNNEFIADSTSSQPWLYPLAYVHPRQPLTNQRLDKFSERGFVGLSLYVFDEGACDWVREQKQDVWQRLAQQRAIISVNSRRDLWRVWGNVLQSCPELRVLVSHLGLPPARATAPQVPEAKLALRDVLALREFPGVHVKLSGFYAMTQPGYAYPHRAAWPYVEVICDAFGANRLLWGSDFSPHLDWLSFPQTYGLLAEMPFWTDREREQIEGGNLLGLLADARFSQHTAAQETTE